MTYQRKIKPAANLLAEITNKMNDSNNDIIHDYRYELLIVEDLLENPFQTVPPTHFIHITTSFCDPDGSAPNAHDHDIYFQREISPAMLYTMLSEHVKAYDSSYKLERRNPKWDQIPTTISELEDWLNNQKALLRTVDKQEPFIQEEGLTVADYPTEYGSIDFFIEYGVSYPHEIWEPVDEEPEIRADQLKSFDDDSGFPDSTRGDETHVSTNW